MRLISSVPDASARLKSCLSRCLSVRVGWATALRHGVGRLASLGTGQAFLLIAASVPSKVPRSTVLSVPFGVVREGAGLVHGVGRTPCGGVALGYLSDGLHTETCASLADKASSVGE